MSDLPTREQIEELRERSKDDRAIIVGSEVRVLCAAAEQAIDLQAKLVEVERWVCQHHNQYGGKGCALTIVQALDDLERDHDAAEDIWNTMCLEQRQRAKAAERELAQIKAQPAQEK